MHFDKFLIIIDVAKVNKKTVLCPKMAQKKGKCGLGAVYADRD